jgi:hypothetical protein
MFDLGSLGTVSALNAYVEVQSTPLANFTGGPFSSFAVTDIVNNAEGYEDHRTVTPSPPPAPLTTFDSLGTTTIEFVSGHKASVEQGDKQCGPASVANSLTFLKEKYGLPIKEENIPGIDGTPPESLVGQLDLKMERVPGKGVSATQFLNGKLKYVSDSKLDGMLETKHQGGFGSMSSGDYPWAGQISKFKGSTPTADFILSELQNGEDVEMWINWETGGAHLVELVGGGKILGIPWIAFTHDSKQGDNTTGTSLLTGGFGFTFLEDTDKDGFLNFHNYVDGDKGEVRFVVSESVVPEPAHVVIFSASAIGWFFSNRTKRRRSVLQR